MSKRKVENDQSSTQKRPKGNEFDPDTARAYCKGSGDTYEVIHNHIGGPFYRLWTAVVFGCKWSQMIANGLKRYQTNRFALFTGTCIHH